MFERIMKNRQLKAKSYQDVLIIGEKIDKISNHYKNMNPHMSMYEMCSYFGLIVAYGNSSGIYPIEENKFIKSKFYQVIFKSYPPLQRASMVSDYERFVIDFKNQLDKNGEEYILDIISEIINKHNQIFPECKHSAENKELLYIKQIVIS